MRRPLMRGLSFVVVSLALVCDLCNGMQIMTITLGGKPERQVTSDDGGALCATDEECNLMDRFVCSSLDGPSCSHVVKPEATRRGKNPQQDLSELLGGIVQKVKNQKKATSQQSGKTHKPTPKTTTADKPAANDESGSKPQKQKNMLDMLDPDAKAAMSQELLKLLEQAGVAAEDAEAQMETFVIGADGKLKRISGEDVEAALAEAQFAVEDLVDPMAGSTNDATSEANDEDDNSDDIEL